MRYKEWIQIEIEHAFFEQTNQCGLDLIPSEAVADAKSGHEKWTRKVDTKKKFRLNSIL